MTLFFFNRIVGARRSGVVYDYCLSSCCTWSVRMSAPLLTDRLHYVLVQVRWTLKLWDSHMR